MRDNLQTRRGDYIMLLLSVLVSFMLVTFLLEPVATMASAESTPGDLEQSMSDTLDLWCEGFSTSI
jgi:hypothetical protein